MKRTEKGKFEMALGTYFKEIHKIYTCGDFREENFYPALKGLIEECSRVLPTQSGANVPVLPNWLFPDL